jgi:hypothetical protein
MRAWRELNPPRADEQWIEKPALSTRQSDQTEKRYDKEVFGTWANRGH